MKKVFLCLLFFLFCFILSGEVIVLPETKEKVNLQLKTQQIYFQKYYNRTIECPWHKLRNKKVDFSRPKVVRIKPGTDFVKVEISQVANFKDVKTANVQNELADFNNLRPDTTYYWRGLKADGKPGKTYSFSTADTLPHWISIPGISNVRDLANWKTVSGKRVKRGMVYRGTEFDDRIKIKPEGRPIFLNDLKIKTDLDLRGPLSKKKFERAFPQLRRVTVQAGSYANMIAQSPEAKAAVQLRQIFGEFANAENYPFYVHCLGGADRTGTVMFLLGCVLGFSDADLIAEFELTSFSRIGVRNFQKNKETNSWRAMCKALAPHGPADAPLRQKGVTYLKFCGITEETMQQIRDILLTK